MSLSPAERETVIAFNDADEHAQVCTHQRPIITKLKKNPAATLIRSGSLRANALGEVSHPQAVRQFSGQEAQANADVRPRLHYIR